ncbi:MAG: dienelactone hydrolase family protein [Polyangiaceae bacterium]
MLVALTALYTAYDSWSAPSVPKALPLFGELVPPSEGVMSGAVERKKPETPRVSTREFRSSTTGNATRTALVSEPRDQAKHPLLVNLHGMCNEPEYSCSPWLAAAGERYFVTCPRGPNHCGADGGFGPYFPRDAANVQEDLDAAVSSIEELSEGRLSQGDAVLTGFSRGGYLALDLAKRAPGRWPYLILVESDVRVDAEMLSKAGVRAIGLIAGEMSTQRAGMEKSYRKLSEQGVRVKLWVMPGAGHAYSNDIADIAAEALELVEKTKAPQGG